MKISNAEKKVLFNHKIRLGESEEQAQYEIERDNCVIENIKYDFRSLQKRVKQLTKENEKLNKLINKNIIPKEIKQIKHSEEKNKKLSNKDRSCSVKYLNRILNYLSDNPKSNKAKIRDAVIITDSSILSEGINFLVKYKLIKEIKENKVAYYDRN